MDQKQNSALRYAGWNLFRSSSRDHVVPGVSPGRKLQRFRIDEAMPARGTMEDAVAVSLEERAAVSASISSRRVEVDRGEDVATGEMKYFTARISNDVVTPPNTPTDFPVVVGIAPFDGYLTEFNATGLGSDNFGISVAVRTSSGGTMFTSFEGPDTLVDVDFIEPDFFPVHFSYSAAGSGVLRRGRVPILAGDQIIFVLRTSTAFAIRGADLLCTVGLEGVNLGRVGSRVASASFDSSIRLNAAANREAAAAAARLQLEREKTRRLEIEMQAKLALADKLGTRTQVQTRQAPDPPPAPYKSSAFTPSDGAGKTFVASWMPNENSIGYLIPDPPRGGKVNVFGDRYSVFDITGKLVSQGPVELVRSQDQIPPSSRLSQNIRTTLSPDTKLSQAQIIATRSGVSPFG